MFVNLRHQSHYSLLSGLPQPKKIVTRAKELGYNSIALTDFGTISGAVEFYESAKKQDIKPIFGCEICTARSQTDFDSVLLIARNLEGWKNLVKIVSKSNDKDSFYYRQCLSLETICNMSNGLIAIIGGKNSEIIRYLFNGKQPTNYIDCQSALNVDYYKSINTIISKYKDIFGVNLFIETQLIDNNNMSSQNFVAEILRKAAAENNVKCVATPNPHYLNAEHNIDHQVIIASSMKNTIPKIKSLINSGGKFPNKEFFLSNNYHLPAETLVKDIYAGFESELENTEYISSLVENFNILGKPSLPHFKCPDGFSESEYLKQLCRNGWASRIQNKIDAKDIEIYKNRVLKELGVFDEAKLAGYFLIVQDYVNWARNQGYLIGPGRGSGSGCLTSYLLGITGVDPIPYDLVFERFYNAGRNTKDHISFPDIDVDFPVEAKEAVIEYIRNKYGRTNIFQLITYSRLMGPSALKEVLRAHEACDSSTMNDITKFIPDDASIADKLEESKETSVLKWTLENIPHVVEKYCRMEDNGTLSGEFATYFEQAIRLEGTYKSTSKHPAAVVISNESLDSLCPMVRDKSSDEKLCGYEMEDLEKVGGIKFDILSVASLSKLQKAKDLLAGKI